MPCGYNLGPKIQKKVTHNEAAMGTWGVCIYVSKRIILLTVLCRASTGSHSRSLKCLPWHHFQWLHHSAANFNIQYIKLLMTGKFLQNGGQFWRESRNWTNGEKCRLCDVFNSYLWLTELKLTVSIVQQLHCSSKSQLVPLYLYTLKEWGSTASSTVRLHTPLPNKYDELKPTLMGLGAHTYIHTAIPYSISDSAVVLSM